MEYLLLATRVVCAFLGNVDRTHIYKHGSFKEVKRGYWYYDGIAKKGVTIVAINYDYYYELDRSDGMPVGDEKPELNKNGEMYMLNWYDINFKSRESFSTAGLTLAEAIRKAEKITSQKIEWLN